MPTFDENIRAAVQQNERLTFERVLRAAAETMTPLERRWAYKRTDHGVTVYTMEDQINSYLVAYGEMHERKLIKAFERIDVRRFADFARNGISIVDWGCGQGLATLVFLDWLAKNRITRDRIKAVRLLEMSDIARNRAWRITSTRLRDSNGALVRQIPWRAGEPLTCEMFSLPDGVPMVHLFSNILDVAAIDLKNVANVVEDMKTRGRSIVLSVSPCNEGTYRLNVFWQMLGKPRLFAWFNEYLSLADTKYTNNCKRCTGFGLGYELERVEVPVLNRFEGISIYHVFDLGGDSDATFNSRPKAWGHYRYSSPGNADSYLFDANKVKPIHAVLNNMVARGNPSRAGIGLEKWLSEELGLTREQEGGYGSICYGLVDEDRMRPILKSVRERIDPSHARPTFTDDERRYERLIITPILVSRVQHAILRGIMTGQVRPVNGVVKVLAVENDIPCAKVALAELEEMFDKIVSLATEEFAVEKYRFEVRTCRPEDVAMCRGQRFDVLLDVSFYLRATENDCLERLHGYYSFGARVETARPQSACECFQLISGRNIVYKPVVRRKKDGTYEALPAADNLCYFLKNIFRKRGFRPGQLPILNRALQDKSVIGLLPTGGGKSLTYQLAGMMQPSVVMVVDPLRSLMKDQYDGLIKAGITATTYINSMQSSSARNKSLHFLEEGKVKFVFVSPERLTMPSFRRELEAMYSNGIYYAYGVIDEVHCVSEWGHDFRFTYLHLGRNLHRFVRRKPSVPSVEREDEVVPLFGLTATASFDVLSDVERELSGAGAYELDADSVIRYENTNRFELQYRVIKIEPPGANVPCDAVERCESDFEEAKTLLAESPQNSARQALKRTRQTYLNQARRNLKKFYATAKEIELADVLRRQQADFEQLLAETNLQRMRERFYDREAIDQSSAVGQEIARANIVANADTSAWTLRDYSMAALVFCPYKGFRLRSDGSPKPPTPLSVESAWGKLKEEFNGVDIAFFTGSTDDHDPRHDALVMENQDRFIANNAAVMVATTAFGMGIDKPNIRSVIEMNHPKSLEALVQEAGRAGRDRKMALATILFSGNPKVDYDVVDFFHKQSFIGRKKEETRIQWLMGEIGMQRDEDGISNTQNRRINGFLESLMGLAVGECMFVTLPYQRTAYARDTTDNEGDGSDDDVDDIRIKEQEIYDKLVYRMCCIGLVQDVECIYDRPGDSPRDLRLKLVHLEDGGYYKWLERFLLRYFNQKRVDKELAKARAENGNTEIEKCLNYLEGFVYDNIQRKRQLAMEEVNEFCREGCRDLKDGETWLDVNEDLKDFIYYYFNSKYARTGYETQDEKPYSLLDDTESGKKYDRSLVEKYMRVVDADFNDGASKDNIKHLLGAVRHITRGASEESKPVLYILHAFCLCYLGFNGNKDLIEQAIRYLGVEGVGAMIDVVNETPADAWRYFEKLQAEFAKRVDLDKDALDGIFSAARVSVHVNKVRSLLNQDVK